MLRVVVLVGMILACARAAGAADRPRFQVAIGMGASLDRNPPNPTPDRPIAAYFLTGGFGDGALGVDLRVFANGSSTKQVGRTAGELVLSARPLTLLVRPESWPRRVLRSMALSLGPAYERVSKAMPSRGRWGAVVSAHVDLPLVPGAEAPSHKDLRVRLGVRRLLAASVQVADVQVRDSVLDLFGMLALVF